MRECLAVAAAEDGGGQRGVATFKGVEIIRNTDKRPMQGTLKKAGKRLRK